MKIFNFAKSINDNLHYECKRSITYVFIVSNKHISFNHTRHIYRHTHTLHWTHTHTHYTGETHTHPHTSTHTHPHTSTHAYTMLNLVIERSRSNEFW